MRTILAMAFVGGFLGACSQQPSGAARAQANDIRIPEMADYIAVVKDAGSEDGSQADFTKKCAKLVKKITGVTVTKVLGETGVIAFSSIPEQSVIVSQLDCILVVEKEASADTLPIDNDSGTTGDVGIPEVTLFNAVVKDAENPAKQAEFTKKCAEKVKAIAGLTVTNVLELTGVISFTSTPEQSDLVAQLDCILAVEADQTVFPSPSTRVGN